MSASPNPADKAKVATIPVVDKAALTIPEFCGRWGIGKSKVYELIRDGKLRVVRLGAGTTRITLEAEREFAASLEGRAA